MTSDLRGRVPAALLRLAPLCVAACALSTDELDAAPDGVEGAGAKEAIPPRGTAATLDVASWNIEWFGDAGNGPRDEALQLQNVRDVIGGTDFDIWGFTEIVGGAQWNDLERQLPGYTGFLANDSNVIDGPAYYSDFGDAEQKVGILYKRATSRC